MQPIKGTTFKPRHSIIPRPQTRGRLIGKMHPVQLQKSSPLTTPTLQKSKVSSEIQSNSFLKTFLRTFILKNIPQNIALFCDVLPLPDCPALKV